MLPLTDAWVYLKKKRKKIGESFAVPDELY